jgi:transcription termination factor Rho
MIKAPEKKTLTLASDEPINARPAPTRKPRRGTKEKPEVVESMDQPEQRPRTGRGAAASGAASEPGNAGDESPRKRRSTRENSRSGGPAPTRGQGYAGGQNGKPQQRERKQSRKNREIVPQTTRADLEVLKAGELRAKAAELAVDVSGLDLRKREGLIEAVLAACMKAEGFIECAGLLDLLPEGYGFLRTSGYLPGENDVYVGMSMIRRNALRKGDWITGQVRPSRENEKFAALQRIDTVNDRAPEELDDRPKFSDLTPVYPDERLVLEHGSNAITARTMDLVAPIGKGQRGLIVSPPKAGKTTILKDIAAAISANDPEVHLMCLLVDERPEEVTDMERSIKGEVVSSTFDMPSENHIAVAELVIERAKRLVETGKDVVILLDSITRLARAYNLAQPASGRILSGGVDSTALYPPKRFLGAARNIENGGSLTILASALIDTGSKMDEVIFEEFKGTGNMELRLDRDLSDRRVFPAIDPISSGTRKEELLLDPQEAPLIWAVRRILANIGNTERAMEMFIKSLKQTNTNAEFLLKTAKRAQTKSSDSVTL